MTSGYYGYGKYVHVWDCQWHTKPPMWHKSRVLSGQGLINNYDKTSSGNYWIKDMSNPTHKWKITESETSKLSSDSGASPMGSVFTKGR